MNLSSNDTSITYLEFGARVKPLPMAITSQYARPSCDSGGLMLPPPSPSPLKTVYAGAARPIRPLLFNDSASSSSSFTVPPTPFNSLNEGSGLG